MRASRFASAAGLCYIPTATINHTPRAKLLFRLQQLFGRTQLTQAPFARPMYTRICILRETLQQIGPDCSGQVRWQQVGRSQLAQSLNQAATSRYHRSV